MNIFFTIFLIFGIFSGSAEGALSGQTTGELFSMDFREAEISDVIRYLSQESGKNIIIGNDIAGKVSLSFKNVTLKEAFDSILKMYNLTLIDEGNIVRITTDSKPVKIETTVETVVVKLHYADLDETGKMVGDLLEEGGVISLDRHNNNLIIKDNLKNLKKITEILKDLDTRTPQILIEARIVEVSNNFSKELGVQWGTGGEKRTESGKFGISGGVSRDSSTGASGPLTGGVGLSGSNLLVNLPANVSSGTGGSVGFFFTSVRDTLRLDVQLSAMEENGHGKILSRPTILTLDNKEAVISSGTEILIPTSTLSVAGTSAGGGLSGSNATTGVTTINAKLELRVRPHVTEDEMVMLYVKTDKKEPDFNRAVGNIPPLTSRTAETNLLVPSGHTVVIGGILTKNKSTFESGVPFFSQIPYLGWLFKKNINRDEESELLIFLTPKIIYGDPPSKLASAE